MASIEFDFSEVLNLTAAIEGAPEEAIPKIRQAVEITARHVKDDWRDDARRQNRGQSKYYAGSVDYDMKLDTDGEIGAEVGPKPGGRWGQGSLGFLEDANGVGARPQKSGQKAARKNEDDFQRGLERAVADVLE
ncbi:hypothetical protein A4X17_11290 [Plantibacter sp. H53]|uniref:hypothetical protein n=1 Tax=Plantibacter sp. H53 TaxID=1827323 RepID=UPI0007DA17E8|nr:hypothetical protein [Plantibacter sp. H53]OAN35060.1 hypothetical protein A4X17_11290 [Plantibacter sp. H53]